MKLLKFLLITFLLTSCGTVVHYDYEKSTNFDHYKTYNYFDEMKTGLSQLDVKRLMRAMDAELQTKGLRRSENPDFYIDILSQDIQSRTNSNVGIGVGGSGRNVGGGVSIGVPIGAQKNTRELIIEFVDDSKTGMFWQAVTESKYSPNDTPEKRVERFTMLVEKMFSSYPPESK